MPHSVPPACNLNQAGQAIDQAARGFRAAGSEITAAEHSEVEAGLAALLDGIAKEVQGMAGMERAGIMGSYSAKVLHARKTLTGPQLAAMLQTLKQERQAALKALAQRVAIELKGRCAAARRAFRRRHHPGKPRQ